MDTPASFPVHLESIYFISALYSAGRPQGHIVFDIYVLHSESLLAFFSQF